MRRLLFAAMFAGGVASFGFAAEPSDCRDDVLPDGPKECRFRHVEAAALSYSGGELTVSWPDYYVVDGARLARNWKQMFPYEPGSIVRVELDPGPRYDLVARFTDQRSGETFLGVTLISDSNLRTGAKGSSREHRAMAGRTKTPTMRSCSIATDVDCTDAQGNPAGTVAVECSGDTGTCSDSCSDSETACCTSTNTTTERTGDGTLISSSTVEERQQSCD